MDGLEVVTPCRLHLGLLDLNGALGRVDGGLGVALAEPSVVLRAYSSPRWSIPPALAEVVATVRSHLRGLPPSRLELLQSIPPHVGLGSQTQLRLAVADLLSRLADRPMRTDALATLVGRGGTSGIGVHAYDQGGVLLDGGHALSVKGGFLPSRYSKAPPPPLLCRLPIPPQWRFVLLRGPGRGVAGRRELEVFADSTPIPRREVERIAHLMVMGLLPAVADQDAQGFGASLDALQGVGFKAIENQLRGKGGANLRQRLRAAGTYGAGLSSFGPTVFGLAESPAHAVEVVESLRQMRGAGRLDVRVCSGSVSGARVRSAPPGTDRRQHRVRPSPPSSSAKP